MAEESSSQFPENPSRTPTALLSCRGTPDFFVQVAIGLEDKPVIKQGQKKVVDALGKISKESVLQETDEFVLAYNAFNVAKHHYLLIRKPFVHQLEVLDALVSKEVFNFLTNNVTYTVVFNGGRHSGSSQPR